MVSETVALMRSWRADIQQGPSHEGSRQAEYMDAVSTSWSFTILLLAPPGESIYAVRA
jgi:hypothetical protein